jgi:hypothetical protein
MKSYIFDFKQKDKCSQVVIDAENVREAFDEVKKQAKKMKAKYRLVLIDHATA